jgi:RNA polymerase sigma-70 factor (ECF subfamily)
MIFQADAAFCAPESFYNERRRLMEQKHYLEDRDIVRIVETYSDMLLRIALYRVKSLSEAEDIVQSVYLRLMTNQPRFRSADHERAWLIRTAVNLCLDFGKSSFRRTSVPLRENMEASPPQQTDEVPDAVRRLPERDRYVICLYYYEGFSIKEIANMLGESVGTITSRLSRARKKLRVLLKGDGHGTISNRS